MADKPTSMKPTSAPRGGLSSLKTLDGSSSAPRNLSRLDTLQTVEGTPSPRRLPSSNSVSVGGSVPSQSVNMPASPTSNPSQLQKTSIPGFNGNTGQPAGRTTARPQAGVWTSFQGNSKKSAQSTNLPGPGAGKTTQGRNQDPAPSTMAQTGGDQSSRAPLIATDGSQPSTMAPWDRPPLGSVPPNSWSPDDHFISNL